MGTFSIWHWLIVILLVFIIPNIPAYWVLKKTGKSGWLFLLFGLPLIGFIYLWVFAFGKWPIEATVPEKEFNK